MKYLLIKLTDPDPALTNPTFYYPDPDSAPPDIRIFGSDPDRISDRIRIESRIEFRIESESQIKFPGLLRTTGATADPRDEDLTCCVVSS